MPWDSSRSWIGYATRDVNGQLTDSVFRSNNPSRPCNWAIARILYLYPIGMVSQSPCTVNPSARRRSLLSPLRHLIKDKLAVAVDVFEIRKRFRLINSLARGCPLNE